MRYLPILQELFESDTVLFLFIGVVIAFFIGFQLKNTKKIILGAMISSIVYLICEFASNIHTNYMLEFILLFVGTIAIGSIVGFVIGLICILKMKL